GEGSPQLKLFRVGRSRSGEYSRGRSDALSCAPIRRIHPLSPISIKTPSGRDHKTHSSGAIAAKCFKFVLEMLTAAVASPPLPPHISGGARPRCGRFGCLGPTTSEIMPWAFPRKVYRGEPLARSIGILLLTSFTLDSTEVVFVICQQGLAGPAVALR